MALCTNSFEVRFPFTSRMYVSRLLECGFVRAGVAEAEGGKKSVECWPVSSM